jgi:hypothetical protein
MSDEPCIWAGCDNGASYRLTILRPCGHTPGRVDDDGNRHPGRSSFPSCDECTAWKRASPEAERPTRCPVCAAMNRPTLISAQSL